MIHQRISALSRQLALVGSNVRPEVRDRWQKSLALLTEFRQAEDGEIIAELHDNPAPITSKVSVRAEQLQKFWAIHDDEADQWKQAIQLPLPRRPAPALKRITFGKRNSLCSL